jgi:hypothetical protein
MELKIRRFKMIETMVDKVSNAVSQARKDWYKYRPTTQDKSETLDVFIAKAAIKAMHEPTDLMLLYASAMSGYEDYLGDEYHTEHHRSMIDAALEGK